MRSFTVDVAALMLLATIALIGHVRAEPLTTRTFRDSSGREIGRMTTHGNPTTFYDNLGRETGRASRSGNSTTFYDNLGRETGRASKSGNGATFYDNLGRETGRERVPRRSPARGTRHGA